MDDGARRRRFDNLGRRLVRKLRAAWWEAQPASWRGPAARQLGPNVWIQDERACLGDFLAELAPAPVWSGEVLRIAHIVNPFTAAAGSGHERVQAATLASMRRAKSVAGDGLAVDLIAIRHVDDDIAGLEEFVSGPPLTRTVLDVASFTKPRPFPILFDILDHGVAAAGKADVIVFTNIDINLAPHFYETLRALWRRGFDAMTINRRTVAAAYDGNGAGTDWALADSDHGRSHPGFDCFVFARAAFASFVPSQSCLGMPVVGRSLLYNMVAHAERMVMLTNVQMTYHFGNERSWRNEAYREYYRHNVQASQEVLAVLNTNASSTPRLESFLERHGERCKLRVWEI